MTAEEIAKRLRKCFKRGNKVLICGNGGSAQQSNHFAAELIHERLPAISLTSDISVITALSNDLDFCEVFSLQVRALGKKGDILIGLSTSGFSQNVLRAYEQAQKMGMEIIAFPVGRKTPRCQENHLRLIHDIWQLLRQ
jgi:D-sedoheptulose 7-phosphate isomerase